MSFASLAFLYAFLPSTLLLYYLTPRRGRNAVLLLASLVFYGAGQPRALPLLAVTVLTAWGAGLGIARLRLKHRGWARSLLIAALALNLGILFYYKYAGFFASLLPGLPLDALLVRIVLPAGISFYTFQSLAYVVDVYRGEVAAEPSLLRQATFISFFPQLIAGPIVRYQDLEAQLRSRRETFALASQGALRLVGGLAKKILIANRLAVLRELLLRPDSGDSLLRQWLLALAFALQIYYDFSGYSDMAIGLGQLFGFRLPENFRAPLQARSFSDFWRRWHITLTRWFRDYVYIPIGGNRVGRLRFVANVMLVWMLTGLWHGADWRFVLWGGLSGLLLLLEKRLHARWLERLPAALQHLYTYLLVLLTFVVFSAPSVAAAGESLAGMLGLGGLALSDPWARYQLGSYALVLLVALLPTTRLVPALWLRLRRSLRGSGTLAVDDERQLFSLALLDGQLAAPAVLLILLILCTASLVDGSFNPFLYFRF